MNELILARHGESEYSHDGLLNGNPFVPVPLTPTGRDEARALGRRLAGVPLDLALDTGFPRTQQTLELALAGRDVPVIEDRRLGDPVAGNFEGRSLDSFRAWAWTAASRERAPGGGESRLAVVRRHAAAYSDLLARPEETILAVVHALPIAYLVLARDGTPPRPRVDLKIEYATPYPFNADEARRALDVLDAWCADPTW